MVFNGCGDEFAEEGIGAKRTRGEFGVELRGDEEGVIFKLHDLGQIGLGVDAGEDHVGILELLLEGIVEFVTVSMAFPNVVLPIAFISQGAWENIAVIGP